MKRYGDLFEKIVSWDNLVEAARMALRGRKRINAARFYFHLETELIQLEDELRSGAYRPLPYRVFEIFEPKRRVISAADIRDRVVHHAICRILEPIFERRAISDSFACRRGKGSQAAAQRVQDLMRRDEWFLKCDISQYFASIDHQRLQGLLRRIIRDRQLLALLDQIIEAPLPGLPPGRGLPIGNLTSQHFANLYLGELDHFIKERLRVGGYVRYMDDFLLFGATRDGLREQHDQIRNFLDQHLGLALAAVGITTPSTAARRTATGTRRATATTTSASASRALGHLPVWPRLRTRPARSRIKVQVDRPVPAPAGQNPMPHGVW